MKKHIILGLTSALLLAACTSHTSNDPNMSIQDQKQKNMQCQQLKRIMATGTPAQAKAAYRESKASSCNN